MSALGRARTWLRAAFLRRRIERDMQDEMAAHLAQAAERFRARGLSAGESLRAAQREFGNLAILQEHARDARGARWIESALGDLRHAGRHFARTPLMAATIVLTLTLGIGISSAAFGAVAGILMRPAPGVPDDDALVTIRGITVDDGRRAARGFSYLELMEYARRPEFSDVAGWVQSVVVAEVGGQEPGTAYAQYVTPNFFRTLGLGMSAGTGFSRTRVDEHTSPDFSAIIGYSYAISQFGTIEAAVGQSMKVNGVTITIVGIAPPRFLNAYGDGEVNTLWMPVSAWPAVDQLDDAFTNRGIGSFYAVGRLRPGTLVRQAVPAVELVASQTSSDLRAASPGRVSFTADVVPLRGNVYYQPSSAETFQMVGAITGLVVLILLVCTTTVSSLLVGAAVTRRHEIAVRLALGASRLRIVRQLLTESLLLSLLAGAAGLTLYALIHRALRDGFVDADVGPTWGTALATAMFAVAASALCGLSPALHATREGVSGVLKDSARTATVRSRLQRVFVVAQIALTQPLLVMLAAMITVVVGEGNRNASRRVNEHVVRASFDTWATVNKGGNRIGAVIERVAALPGVVAVIPQVSGVRAFRLDVPAHGADPARQVSARTQQVPPGYFRALDIRLLQGRELTDHDSTVVPTPIIIGSDFAKVAFGAVSPVGKRLRIPGRRSDEVEIVGVVAAEDLRNQKTSSVTVYTPMGGVLAVPGLGPDAMLIRTRNPAESLLPTIREIARTEAPMLPIRSMQTFAQMDREARSEIIEATSASALGGLITLLLASIGLYAVVALAVGQRQREIGVRISLGASPGQVVAMFFRGGLRVSLLGMLIGLPVSIAALNVLATQMGVPRTNMSVIAAAVALSVILVASLASWLPARRAAGADPLVALRDS
jgi:predicted permease